MIPLRDTVPSAGHPMVTRVIIGLNAAVYLAQLAMGPGMDAFVYVFGLVPARHASPFAAHYFPEGAGLFSFLSFMFIHGGFWHIAGNMWFLHIFGDNVEDHLGPLRYLVFYLACGVGSGLAHIFFNPSSPIPVIGASGAIAGVMGAYLILHPRARILTLIPIIFIPYFIEIPAFFFLGVWFVIQFVQSISVQADAAGVAWQAHAGGFVIGMALLKLAGRLPSSGASDRIRAATRKKKTETFQVIRPAAHGDDPHLRGEIHISPFEALAGSKKIVNIPWGFHKRLFRVHAPAGITGDQTLRLKGMGKTMPDGQRGDMLLKVVIRTP
ncbi:Rhomboid family intramembrane serine protease [Candidatus Desulfarcum epimagneticum]|uniref:Rhomboid family intramembrane serine protease n=1 Tax=uncultured Desulfobacteraceae bacterium TaxID=218296 RepID=A0A484HJR1_9BACT|nr:Rhomboid family intramembrane serine protease [uncultured Desulfobacteraceae bacterium]